MPELDDVIGVLQLLHVAAHFLEGGLVDPLLVHTPGVHLRVDAFTISVGKCVGGWVRVGGWARARARV